MKTILYINDEHCTGTEQLKSYFSQLEVGSVFEDMLDYGRHGDITSWLQENGYLEYAEGMKAIDSGLGDADFIKAMSKVLSGEESVAIDKKPYRECFSIEEVLIERKGDKAEVILSIKVHKGVNESYEIKVSSNWGTKGELFNPNEHEESKLVKKTIEYNRRAGKGEFGEVSVEVEGDKIDVKDDALKGNQTFTVKGVSFTMIAVEGGPFQMGAQSSNSGGDNYDSDAFDDENPVHSVTLSDYYIGETEVTQELWEAVMGSNPSYFKGRRRPVEQVSWNDCQTFIKKLNQLTGKDFRLPTEAEWEYAARGGNKSKGCKYSGSNTIRNVAWHDGNSNNKTHDVKTKQANELGIHDMSGNVREWCQDWYGSYSSGSQTNPNGPSSGSSRVLRGGSWGNYARYCRVSNRFYLNPGNRDNYYGFRLVLQ